MLCSVRLVLEVGRSSREFGVSGCAGTASSGRSGCSKVGAERRYEWTRCNFQASDEEKIVGMDCCKSSQGWTLHGKSGGRT